MEIEHSWYPNVLSLEQISCGFSFEGLFHFSHATMLTAKRHGLYWVTAIVAVFLHITIREILGEAKTRWILGLAVLYAFKVAEARQKLKLKDRSSYYIPLAIVLLVLGEIAKVVNERVSLYPGNDRRQRWAAIHASLSFSLVAEAEWWHNFVRLGNKA